MFSGQVWWLWRLFKSLFPDAILINKFSYKHVMTGSNLVFKALPLTTSLCNVTSLTFLCCWIYQFALNVQIVQSRCLNLLRKLNVPEIVAYKRGIKPPLPRRILTTILQNLSGNASVWPRNGALNYVTINCFI